MSLYHVESNSSDRLDHMYHCLRTWSQDTDHQLIFITQDNRQFPCSSKILSMFSSFIRNIVNNTSIDQTMFISVPLDHDSLHALVQMLCCGVASLDLVTREMILEAAHLLDIKITGVVEELVDQEELEEMNNYFINEEPPDDAEDIEIDNAELDFISCSDMNPVVEYAEEGLKIEDIKTEVDEERLFACKFCDKHFKRQDVLKKHMRCVHLKNKDIQENNIYRCDDCDKVYFSRDHLTRHQIQHSVQDRKPFTCTVCSKTFSRKDALSRHFKNKH